MSKFKNVKERITALRIVCGSLLILFSNCVTIAPGPFMTYGGPKTTPKKGTEAAIGVGTGLSLFDGAHAGATGYFGRYKHGVSEKLDLGFDFYGAARNDGGTMSGKIATRYQLTDASRLEFSIGAADDSYGKSLHTDFAYTIGTIEDRTWNYYTSLRGSFAKGYAGNVINLPGQKIVGTDSEAPPDTFMVLVNLGAQGRLNESQRVIFEGGYGYIFPYGRKKGPGFYFSIGMVFDFIPKDKPIHD